MECGAEINVGSSGVATFDWSTILRNTTRLQDTKMLVDSIPETLGTGAVSRRNSFSFTCRLRLQLQHNCAAWAVNAERASNKQLVSQLSDDEPLLGVDCLDKL
jgi:hypothetical protein